MERHFVKATITIPEEQQPLVIACVECPSFLGAEQSGDVLTLWFETDTPSHEPIAEYLSRRLGDIADLTERCTIETVPHYDWHAQWQASLTPVTIGDRLVVLPGESFQPTAPATTSTTITIVIEPKMAFGTGHHPTTQMCAELLLDVVQQGQQWLDIGTGSGLLAIVAGAAGARRVLAIDNDPGAIAEATENVRRNGYAGIVEPIVADIASFHHQPMDGIVANMYSTVLEREMPRLHRMIRVGGHLIASGILHYQAPIVERIASDVGFESRTRLERGEWVALDFVRKR